MNVLYIAIAYFLIGFVIGAVVARRTGEEPTAILFLMAWPIMIPLFIILCIYSWIIEL